MRTRRAQKAALVATLLAVLLMLFAQLQYLFRHAL
jgi:hypothetical protein